MEVYITPQCQKDIEKTLSFSQQKELVYFIDRLGLNNQRGKHLVGGWLYEYKIQGKRIYYVSDHKSCILIAASTKKQQAQEIRHIKDQEKHWKNQLQQLD